MKISVNITGINEWNQHLRAVPEEFQEKLEQKVRYLTDKLYDKVLDNVGGGLLQMKSGELYRSMRKQVRVDGRAVFGVVYPEGAASGQNMKAVVHEVGGEGYYDIDAKDAPELVFWWQKAGKLFKGKHVYHPPATAKYYLLSALESMADEIDLTFEELADEVANS